MVGPLIAPYAMAKRAVVTTGMAIADARRRCPGIALVPQQPDLYTRIHHRIVAAVLDLLPIDAVCSIDELAATVTPRDVPAASCTRSSSASVMPWANTSRVSSATP